VSSLEGKGRLGLAVLEGSVSFRDLFPWWLGLIIEQGNVVVGVIVLDVDERFLFLLPYSGGLFESFLATLASWSADALDHPLLPLLHLAASLSGCFRVWIDEVQKQLLQLIYAVPQLGHLVFEPLLEIGHCEVVAQGHFLQNIGHSSFHILLGVPLAVDEGSAEVVGLGRLERAGRLVVEAFDPVPVDEGFPLQFLGRNS
jgi:hypothetical protein